MYQNKNTIDKYMLDNWHSTPIAFDMENFTMPSNKKWVSVALIPYDRELIGLSPQHGRKLDYALLRVRTYDVSVTKSYLLAYEMQTLLECKTLTNSDGTNLLIDLGVGDGDSTGDMGNNVFRTTLNFVVKKYN